MSASMNEVQLMGNLGADPEVRNLPSGGKVVNLSIATSEKWKDKNTGEQREKTEWHRVVIFQEGIAGVAEKYLHKGSKVFVRGALQTRKWQDQSGQDKYSTEVVLQGFNCVLKLLDGRQDGQSGGGGQQQERPQEQQQRPAQQTYAQPSGGVDSDDIPFG